MSQYVFTKEHRQALSNAAQGRKHSEEARHKISLLHRGRKLSEETKHKMSEAHKRRYANGYSMSEEARRHVGAVTRQRLTPEYLQQHPTWFMSHSKKGVRLNTGRTHFKKGSVSREHNTQWKGDSASYGALHRRLYEAYGKPTECQRCGITDPDKWYDWANLTGRYNDMSDYQRMCRSCHRKYDYARRTSA